MTYPRSARKRLSSLGPWRVKPQLIHCIISPELWWCDCGEYFSFDCTEVDRKLCLDERFPKSQPSCVKWLLPTGCGLVCPFFSPVEVCLVSWTEKWSQCTSNVNGFLAFLKHICLTVEIIKLIQCMFSKIFFSHREWWFLWGPLVPLWSKE